MCEDEYLVDICSLKPRCEESAAVGADLYHLSDKCPHDKQCATVHTGYRVVNNDDLSLGVFILIEVALHHLIETAVSQVVMRRNGLNINKTPQFLQRMKSESISQHYQMVRLCEESHSAI